MSRIFITGDTHGSIDSKKLKNKKFPDYNSLTKEDFLIITGDFGFLWDNSPSNEYWLNWITNKKYTTLFVDGNHENFPMIFSYPVVDFHGGKAHKINESVFHLMRGEVFNICGKSFFTFGGAKSHDIQYRKEFVSWWKEEEPNYSDYQHGLETLAKFPNVDYIITHDCPESIQYLIDGEPRLYETYQLNRFFEEIKNTIGFKHWFFGHYHIDLEVGDKFTCLYDNVYEIGGIKRWLLLRDNMKEY